MRTTRDAYAELFARPSSLNPSMTRRQTLACRREHFVNAMLGSNTNASCPAAALRRDRSEAVRDAIMRHRLDCGSFTGYDAFVKSTIGRHNRVQRTHRGGHSPTRSP